MQFTWADGCKRECICDETCDALAMSVDAGEIQVPLARKVAVLLVVAVLAPVVPLQLSTDASSFSTEKYTVKYSSFSIKELQWLSGFELR